MAPSTDVTVTLASGKVNVYRATVALAGPLANLARAFMNPNAGQTLSNSASGDRAFSSAGIHLAENSPDGRSGPVTRAAVVANAEADGTLPPPGGQQYGGGIGDPASYNGGFLQRELEGESPHPDSTQNYLANYKQIQINNYWVWVGNTSAKVDRYLIGGGDVAIWGAGRTVDYVGTHARDLLTCWMLCGQLFSREPQLPDLSQETPVIKPQIDMVNDLRRWAMKQWERVHRITSGGE